ncbi:hypothetical protein F443_20571 [Phytophthora nicotianae P1569]|uniref:Uncharacterized protein n=1 Tax=Phytophthora nicotianae P1569 TaxID=1317065 RepID=V9E291_PHYNI|nr:hypothetical protein F443_20571 [Phytophthora nicotianae P1569]
MSRRLSMPERHPSKLAFLNDRSGSRITPQQTRNLIRNIVGKEIQQKSD